MNPTERVGCGMSHHQPHNDSERRGGTLKGLGWGHTRAMGPLTVTAQVFADLRPGFRLNWDARSLWAFGEAPPDEFTDYDLVVLDHPMIGLAAEHGLLLPLDDCISAEWLAAHLAQGVGGSSATYVHNGHQWAVAIDAACTVAAARGDLLVEANLERPRAWNDVLRLARETGRVAVPLAQVDALSLFLTLCANQGDAPLQADRGCVVSSDIGLLALEQLEHLLSVVDPRCLDMNPIAVLNWMSSTDDILYCPHAYGYSNYSRNGYASRILTFHDLPGPGEAPHRGAVLGGAGLAITSACERRTEALDYLRWVAGETCQQTTYVFAGGQPANTAAWEDATANAITGNFFTNTRATLEAAYIRPRHYGMPSFQVGAGEAIRRFLKKQGSAAETLSRLDTLFRASLLSTA